MQRNEFDQFIKNYRSNADEHVAMSGESSAFFAEYKVQKLIEWLPSIMQPGTAILDYGCGDGLMTVFARQYLPEAELYGIDPSPLSIQQANKMHIKAKFDVLTGNCMPYADEAFDVVYAAGVFHHIPFDEHELWTKEVFRVLKPGGIFVLFELNPYNPMTQLVFRRSPVDRDATMLTASYGTSLIKPYVNLSYTNYYCFFPAFLKRLRFLEKFMTLVPFGALYAVLGRKKQEL